jgi:hypothetical protein
MANDKASDKRTFKTERETPRRTQQGEVPPQPAPRRAHWVWPLGLAVAGLGGVTAFMLRGCWHTKMGWPVKFDEEFSYQVCTNCGIKRLYDEQTFHAYGPYGYDLHELIARERASRLRRLRRHTEAMTKIRQAPAETGGEPPTTETPRHTES